MRGGDFARYIIGTNSETFNWSSQRLDEPQKPTQKQVFGDFVESLTVRQTKAWDIYFASTESKFYFTSLTNNQLKLAADNPIPDEELERVYSTVENSFRRTLGEKKRNILDEYVIPYLEDPQKDEFQFDLSLVQRWIFNRVVELGWTVERFGQFDRWISRWGGKRRAHNSERIGKKYQWIAYHEFLARIADNFRYRGKWWQGDPEDSYDGPWQDYFRDIDPSFILRKTERDNHWESSIQNWWFKSQYDAWESIEENSEWVSNRDDLQDARELIEISNREDDSHWLLLRAFFKWGEPIPPEEDKYDFARRDIWYRIDSAIVRKVDLNEIISWANKEFRGNWLKSGDGLRQPFLGEFFWSSAFEYFNRPVHREYGWIKKEINGTYFDYINSTDGYDQEDSGYDCSIDGHINVRLPSKLLVHGLDLDWMGKEGHYYDKNENLIAFDPSVLEIGPSALLIKRKALLEYLNKNEYAVIWIVTGEKRIIGGSMRREDWKGRLDISGLYYLKGGKLEDLVKFKHNSE